MSGLAGARGQWSDGETRALIRAWGPLHLRRDGGSGSGSLDVAEWRRVCSAVNVHRADAGLHFNRSLAQCQKKVYTLKDQYNKELAKGLPTPGWRHFVQLHSFLAGPLGPPPGFPAKLPTASVKVEEVAEEEEVKGMEEEKEEEEEAAGVLVGSMAVPAKRHCSSLQDPSGGPTRMPVATATDKEEEVKEEEVGGECPVSAGCSTAGLVAKLAAVTTEMSAVTTKLAEVYERVEMERLSVEKGKMAMEREKSLGGAPKVEAGNPGETDDN